jgi:hypothetical protein
MKFPKVQILYPLRPVLFTLCALICFAEFVMSFVYRKDYDSDFEEWEIVTPNLQANTLLDAAQFGTDKAREFFAKQDELSRAVYHGATHMATICYPNELSSFIAIIFFAGRDDLIQYGVKALSGITDFFVNYQPHHTLTAKESLRKCIKRLDESITDILITRKCSDPNTSICGFTRYKTSCIKFCGCTPERIEQDLPCVGFLGDEASNHFHDQPNPSIT